MNALLKKRCAFQTPITVSFALAFIGFYIGATTHRAWVLLVCLGIAVCINLWGHLTFAIDFRKNGGQPDAPDKRMVLIQSALLAFVSLSLLLSAIRTLRTSASGTLGTLLLILALLTLLLTALEVRFYLRFATHSSPREYFRKKRRTMLPIAALLLVLFLLNLEIFKTWFRWDSYEYYAYSGMLSFSDFTDLEAFRLANHSSYVCSLIYLFMTGITGNHEVSVYWVNILLLLLGTLAFWRITAKFIARENSVLRLIVTCVYAFSPFTHGMIYTIGLESFLAFGLLIFIWADSEKLPAVQLLAALLICFSKETGAIILTAIMAIRLAAFFFGESSKGTKPYRRLDPALTLPVLAIGCLWLYDYFSCSWLSTNKLANEEINNTFNNFSFEPIFIRNRLTSLLFSNYTWLILLFIVVGFAIGRIKNGKEQDDEKFRFFWQCITAILTSLMPTFLFVTYNHIRYATPTVVLLLLLLPEAVARISRNVKLSSALCGVLAVCSFAQCYVTADPTMYLFHDTISKGHGSIVCTRNDILNIENETSVEGTGKDPIHSVSVRSTYNREIMYFDFAIDSIIKEIGYEDGTVLLLSSEYMEPFIGGYVYTEYLLLGFGYSYTDYPKYVAWDAEEGRRCLTEDRDERLMYTTVSSERDVYNMVELSSFDRIIYLQFPFRDNQKQDEMLRNSSSTEVARVNVMGWELVAFELTAK